MPSKTEYLQLKALAHQECLKITEEKLLHLREALESARAALESEGKSSMGDKYETGRAMAQLEMEKHQASAQVLKQQWHTLQAPEGEVPGLLIDTSSGIYYLLVGIGPLKIGDTTVFAVSPQSPIGQLLVGKTPGEPFVFRDKKYTIHSVS
jgi:transcription elongation GreA/GreB family factor